MADKNDNRFNIPSENVSALIRDLKKLKKRADKLGLDNAISWSREPSFTVKNVKPNGMVEVREFVPFVIFERGDIKLPGGWHLVGVLDHNSTDLPIIKGVPGEELPRHFRDAGPDCDHCRFNRRRHTTIVIRNDANEYKHVGSTCIADYLGHKNALSIANAHAYIAEFIGGLRDEDEGGYYNRAPSIWELESCLAFTAALVRLDGWAPRSAEGFSTADAAWDWFIRDFQPYTIKSNRNRSETISPPEVEDKDRELAKKALEWLDVQDPRKARSDYIYNIQAIANAEYPRVTSKTIGLAASIIGTYKRVVERELRYANERKAKAEANGGRVSQHVGEIKERIRGLEIEVFGAYESQGDFGVYTRVVFKDKDGNEFVWFASGYSELEAGRKYIVDATVKKHNEFKGSKQTQVNRVTVKGGVIA